jgi:ABC-type antimicrobial peptide transport system permease subunit
VDEKAVLAALAIILGVALELTVGWPTIGRRCVSALRQVRVISAAESVVLMGIAVGMSFVIVFMLGPALGEALRFAGR